MLRDAAPRSPLIADDEQPADRLRDPSSLSGDRATEPDLAVERRERRLEIGHDGFDLDHEHYVRQRVEGENVDGAALAVDVERHVGRHDPTRNLEQADRALDEVGVTLIEKTVEGFAIPREPAVDAGTECRGDPIEGRNGHP